MSNICMKESKKPWTRKRLNNAHYSFYKSYLVHIPIQELQEIYQIVVRKYADQMVDVVSMKSEDFYKSTTWRKLRVKALHAHGKRCKICGRTHKEASLHVDHIRPRWLYPEDALNIQNLRVLCEDCNIGKGAKVQINKTVLRRVGIIKQP